MFRWGFSAAFVVYAIVAFGLRPDPQNRLMFAVFCIFAVLFSLAAPALWRLKLRKYASRQSKSVQGFGQPVLLAVTPDGYAIAARVGETRMSWDGVLDITETSDHLFLWISAVYAVVVPKRAFIGKAGMVERIHEYHGLAARGVDRAGATT